MGITPAVYIESLRSPRGTYPAWYNLGLANEFYNELQEPRDEGSNVRNDIPPIEKIINGGGVKPQQKQDATQEGEVYGAARDLDGIFVGTHQYTILIPTNPNNLDEKDQYLLRDLGDGRKGIVIGAHNDNGRLRAVPNQRDDLIATREFFGDSDNPTNNRLDFSTEVSRVALPDGTSNDAYIGQVLDAARNYNANEHRNNINYPISGTGANSNSFNQSIHRVLGGQVLRNFGGADVGRSRSIDDEYFEPPPSP